MLVWKLCTVKVGILLARLASVVFSSCCSLDVVDCLLFLINLPCLSTLLCQDVPALALHFYCLILSGEK